MNFLNPVLDPILDPLLSLAPFWIIFIIGFLITLFTSLIYKFATDQDLMKRLKQDQKDMQKKLKEIKENPEKLQMHQKEMMQKNLEYMKHSMKPMLYTFLPIIILFGWLGTHLAFSPIFPGEPFSVELNLNEEIQNVTLKTSLELISYDVSDNVHSWSLKGDEGEYLLEFHIEDKIYEHKVIISNDQRYIEPLKQFNDNKISFIKTGNAELKPLGSVSIFGWEPGWLGIYLVISVILSIVIRKLLKIH